MAGTAGASGQPLLREFIPIPERTSTSDFALELTEGVADTDTTLRDYVVTDRLAENFDQALGLIASAVGGGGSKAAYLHGSFGSGKSHFMAVLHALLRGDPRARSRDEFAGLLARHDGWLAGRRFLLVPYYLLALLDLLGWTGQILRSSDLPSRPERSQRLADLASAFLAVTAAAERTQPPPEGLAPSTVNEVRRLFNALVNQPFQSVTHTLAWSLWRRRRHAAARACHYRRRERQLN